MKLINSIGDSRLLNHFFEYSAKLLILPVALAFILLFVFYQVPSTFEYYYLLIAGTWIYIILFLVFDIPLSFLSGKTGTYVLKTDGPRILVRKSAASKKSYTTMLIIKCLIYVCVIVSGIAYFQIF